MPNNNFQGEFQWVESSNSIGEMLFTFGDGRVYNLFKDYPQELTKEQKDLFDLLNPYWANMLNDKK